MERYPSNDAHPFLIGVFFFSLAGEPTQSATQSPLPSFHDVYKLRDTRKILTRPQMVAILAVAGLI